MGEEKLVWCRQHQSFSNGVTGVLLRGRDFMKSRVKVKSACGGCYYNCKIERNVCANRKMCYVFAVDGLMWESERNFTVF